MMMFCVRPRSLGASIGALAAVAALTAQAAAADASTATTPRPKLAIHGFLSQAYAISSDVQVLGIPTRGTTDYRTLALQIRYDLSDRDAVLFQLSHESLGDSPLQRVDDIELDWGFYERTFAAGTSLRVGRVPIPFGIYNELRDVGTVLEFYRPPIGIYFEGAFANESVDGVVARRTFARRSAWSLEGDLYYGGWERQETGVPVQEVGISRADDAVGGQLWLDTPVDGLRLGLAAQHYTLSGGLPALRFAERDPNSTYLLSIDADLSRWVARAEYQHIDGRIAFVPTLDLDAYYVQLGYRFSDHVALHLRYEDTEIELTDLLGSTSRVDPYYEDLAVSCVYSFRPELVLKLEAHRVEAFLIDELPATGILPAETDYGILSLSASF